MKVKTSVAISEEVLGQVDALVSEYKNRSALFEEALQFFLEQKIKTARHRKDLKIINRKYESLNEEAEDVLSYQVEL